MEEVTEAIVTDFKIKCPNCGEYLEGWVCDPRGAEDTCDYCNKSFKISINMDFEFY